MSLPYRLVDDYLELGFVMKMPMYIVKEHNAALRRYKYHVESPATRGGEVHFLEFISGPKTRGGLIDRSLLLLSSAIKCGGKDIKIFIFIILYF